MRRATHQTTPVNIIIYFHVSCKPWRNIQWERPLCSTKDKCSNAPHHFHLFTFNGKMCSTEPDGLRCVRYANRYHQLRALSRIILVCHVSINQRRSRNDDDIRFWCFCSRWHQSTTTDKNIRSQCDSVETRRVWKMSELSSTNAKHNRCSYSLWEDEVSALFGAGMISSPIDHGSRYAAHARGLWLMTNRRIKQSMFVC